MKKNTIDITLLGTGPSGGVPSLGRGYGQCDPNNKKNIRSRSGILLKINGFTLLIDASSDIREQLLRENSPIINAFFITHSHSDHVSGIDDLRYNFFLKDKQATKTFINEHAMDEIINHFSYAFVTKNPRYPSFLEAEVFKDEKFLLENGCELKPLKLIHGEIYSHGLRIDNFAYLPDFNDIPNETIKNLYGLDLIIVDCLGHNKHTTHMHVEGAIKYFNDLKPKKMILTHLGPTLDYENIKNELPDGIEPAYDGMKISL